MLTRGKVFTGVLFVSTNALSGVIHFLVSAFKCRMILTYELVGMRQDEGEAQT
jgi:hypothetical protein